MAKLLSSFGHRAGRAARSDPGLLREFLTLPTHSRIQSEDVEDGGAQPGRDAPHRLDDAVRGLLHLLELPDHPLVTGQPPGQPGDIQLQHGERLA